MVIFHGYVSNNQMVYPVILSLLQAVVDHALKTRNVELVSFTSAVSSRAAIAGSKRQMGISCEYPMNIL